jgi:hypothetical protein
MRIVAERYRIMRTHDWDEEVLETLQRELRRRRRRRFAVRPGS